MSIMEFNRVVSLVLGFIVLILAFVWISNKFRAKNSTTQTNQPTITVTITPTTGEEKGTWNPFSFLFDNKTPTPTPTKGDNAIKVIGEYMQTPTPQIRISIIEGKNNPEKSEQTAIITKDTNTLYNKKPVQQIPETGSPTVLIPILSLLIAGGFAIKKAR